MTDMRNVFCSSLLFVLSLIAVSNVSAQIDEVSEVTGLPIPIGAPVIYGQVAIRNIPKSERRPTVNVLLIKRGIQNDKYQASDRGYWYFLKTPEAGDVLVFEVDGTEVGRAVINSYLGNRYRQDTEFDWNALRGASARSAAAGVVSARDRYDRTAQANKTFEQALQASRQNPVEALKLFSEIVAADKKDFNAWMHIGALHYSAKRVDEARAAFEKAVALKPDYLLAVLNLGRLELSQKKFDPAVAALKKAVEIDPNSADANHLLGEAYLQNKKGSLAVGHLNKAIELAPVEKAELHLRLAALYNAAGYKDRAALEYKAFLEKVKDHPDRKQFEQYIKENLPE